MYLFFSCWFSVLASISNTSGVRGTDSQYSASANHSQVNDGAREPERRCDSAMCF